MFLTMFHTRLSPLPQFFASAKDSKQHAAASGMEIIAQATAAAGEVVDDISDSEMVGGCTLALGVQGRPAAGWPERSPEHVVSQMSKPDLMKRRQELARDPSVVALDTQTIPHLLQLQASYTGPHADRMDAHNPLRCPFYICRVRLEMELRVAQQWPNDRAVGCAEGRRQKSQDRVHGGLRVETFP